MSGADDQSSTPPESRMDFDFGLWQSFYANEEPDTGLLFVSSNLDRAPNSHVPQDTHMTVSGQSTDTCAREPLPDSTHPVQWQPENMTTMNDSQQLQVQMMHSLHEDQNVHDDFGETALPEITITDNDIHQDTGDIWPWQTSVAPQFLRSGWFSGSSTPSSASSAMGTESSNSDHSVVAASFGPGSDSMWTSPASDSEEIKDGPTVVSEPTQSRKGTKRARHQKGAQEAVGRSASPGSSRGPLNHPKRRTKQSKPTNVYRTINHSKKVWPEGHPDKAKLYLYGKDGEIEGHIAGFAALVRSHRKSIQSWATKCLTVQTMPYSCDEEKSPETLRRNKKYHTREVREYFCGQALWTWYGSVLQSVKSMNLDADTATALSNMTIDQIRRPGNVIADLISWESLQAALTTSAENNPTQTISAAQLRPHPPYEWKGVMKYQAKPETPSH